MLFRPALLPLFALSLPLFSLSAQPLPSGSLPAKAPDRAQWLILVKDSAPSLIDEQPKVQTNAPASQGGQPAAKETNAPAASSLDRQILVTKDKPLYHEQETGPNPAERWYTGEVAAVVRPGMAPSVVFSKRGEGSFADFPDLSWISAKNYVGTRNIHGTDCLVFKGAIGRGAEAIPAQACLDAKTRLPLVLEVSGTVQTYNFQPTPSARLSFPASLQAQVETMKKTMNAAGNRPDRPF